MILGIADLKLRVQNLSVRADGPRLLLRTERLLVPLDGLAGVVECELRCDRVVPFRDCVLRSCHSDLSFSQRCLYRRRRGRQGRTGASAATNRAGTAQIAHRCPSGLKAPRPALLMTMDALRFRPYHGGRGGIHADRGAGRDGRGWLVPVPKMTSIGPIGSRSKRAILLEGTPGGGHGRAVAHACDGVVCRRHRVGIRAPARRRAERDVLRGRVVRALHGPMEPRSRRAVRAIRRGS